MPKVKSIRFTAVLTKAENNIGWHYIPVEKRFVEKMRFTGNSRRVLCTLNAKHTFQCGLMPMSGGFYIIVNKKVRDAVGISLGNTVKVELKQDDSIYGLPMPKELREVLKQDPEGNRYFHSLTPGKQRSVIYFVGKAPNVDRRIQYSLIFIEHLKKNDGKIVHDRLTEEIKRPIPGP